VVTQIANPKALMFFAALLPQFVDPGAPVPRQIAILALTSVMIELGVLTTYALVAARARTFAAQPRLATVLNRMSGGLLIGAGVGLARLRD
jgi:homoserine/homoserine lactone efflux protein